MLNVTMASSSVDKWWITIELRPQQVDYKVADFLVVEAILMLG